jgi:hypothetical protein
MYSIYWVHLPHHTNPLTEGYIGLSKNVRLRKNNHRHNPYNKIMEEMSHRKDVIWDVLHTDLDRHWGLMIENYYRPSDDIGWNLQRGGYNHGCNHRNRTDYHRNVVNEYKTKPFYIDDMEFPSKQSGLRWLVSNGICSKRTGERRITGKDKVSLQECKSRR